MRLFPVLLPVVLLNVFAYYHLIHLSRAARTEPTWWLILSALPLHLWTPSICIRSKAAPLLRPQPAKVLLIAGSSAKCRARSMQPLIRRKQAALIHRYLTFQVLTMLFVRLPTVPATRLLPTRLLL